MKMDFVYSDCCYRNAEDISSRYQEKVKQETESFSYISEVLSQVNECSQPLPDENNFITFWNNNYQNYHEHEEKRQSSCLANNGVERNDFNELDEILKHVPRLPSCLKKIGGKKINFLMIATTLDKETIIEDLGKTFNCKTEFQALPLSFEMQSTEHMFEEIVPERHAIAKEKQESMPTQCTQRLKRKHFEIEEQTFENQEDSVLLESGGCKKSRMSWMTTKATDFDEEDKDLEQQIKMLIQTKQL